MTAANRPTKASAKTTAAVELTESPKEITTDLTEYLTEYARENPGYAALWCLGIGFVLGWKLKPW